MANRLDALTALADRLDQEPRMRGEAPHGWYARAFARDLAAKLEEMRRQHMTPAQAVQAVLESGLYGIELHQALIDNFPAIDRRGAFAGAAAAVTLLQAKVTAAELSAAIAESERDAAIAELEAIKAPMAA